MFPFCKYIRKSESNDMGNPLNIYSSKKYFSFYNSENFILEISFTKVSGFTKWYLKLNNVIQQVY